MRTPLTKKRLHPTKPVEHLPTERFGLAVPNGQRKVVSPNKDQEFIDAKQAAMWLGVPLRSLHQYVQKGLLPSYKLGRHRLFRKIELLSALEADRIASRNEILR